MYRFFYQTLRLRLVTNWIFKKTLELTLLTNYISTTLKLTLVTMYRFSYQTLRLTLLTNVIFKNPGTDAYTKYILTTLKLTLSYLLTLLLGYLLTCLHGRQNWPVMPPPLINCGNYVSRLKSICFGIPIVENPWFISVSVKAYRLNTACAKIFLNSFLKW